MTTMTDEAMMNKLYELLCEVRADLENVGIEAPPVDLKLGRACNSLGSCKCNRLTKKYTITFSKVYINLSDKHIKDVLMHETIHTLPGCMNHGPNFKHYMYIVNCTLGYNVTVKDSTTEAAALKKESLKEVPTVELRCSCGCELVVRATRKVAKHPENYCCKKHGLTLHRV